MASELTLSQISSIAQISEGLAIITNQKNNLFKSQTLDERWPRSIYEAWRAFFVRLTTNPNDTSLRALGEWIMQLCGPLGLQALNTLNNIVSGALSISNPGNQSVNVGSSASFSVTVTSGSPYTIQWYRNGVAISGATSLTYTLTNAQIADSGATFFATATNAAGPISSGVATLTVTAALLGYYFQGVTDYSTLLLAGTDTVPYLGTFSITSGQPLLVTFPDATDTETIVVKYPATETTKTNYLNPPPSGPDAGSIPSLALEGTSFGGWKYIFSRTGTTFGVNSVNKQVQFS